MVGFKSQISGVLTKKPKKNAELALAKDKRERPSGIMPTYVLSKSEETLIEKIMVEHCPAEMDEKEFQSDEKKLKEITANVRSVVKQSAYLMGKLVHEAKEILNKYGGERGAFTSWLNDNFASRKTAYNVLSFYELNEELKERKIKENLEHMPLKIAYMIANRQADLEAKKEVIKAYKGHRADDFAHIVNEMIPLEVQTKKSRKEHDLILIKKIKSYLNSITRRRGNLSEDAIKGLQEVAIQTLVALGHSQDDIEDFL